METVRLFGLLAQVGNEEVPEPVRIMVNLIPWVLIFAIALFFFIRYGKACRVSQELVQKQVERSFQHMDHVEAQQARMIELLERLNERFEGQQ
jgi:hypothetical protein